MVYQTRKLRPGVRQLLQVMVDLVSSRAEFSPSTVICPPVHRSLAGAQCVCVCEVGGAYQNHQGSAFQPHLLPPHPRKILTTLGCCLD